MSGLGKRIAATMWIGARIVVLTCIVAPGILRGQTPPSEINTIMMESTFKIEGVGTGSGPTIGTIFVLGRPLPKTPAQGRYVLVTAAHVLDSVSSETATVQFRRMQASHWERVPLPLKIREGGRPLWTKHPQADVAAMYVSLPEWVKVPLLSTDQLADDEALAKTGLHPGDELNCLGYPLGAESSPAGFPVLRSGKVASYPLLPTRETKVFLLDFRVFKGNSGGPVYFGGGVRSSGAGVIIGGMPNIIIGLVTEEQSVAQLITLPYSTELRQLQLELGAVVHASLIKETINLLPPIEHE